MATTTTNNGWTIPQSTDLVTNGATAIATLGNNIDTSVGTGLKAWTAYTPTFTNFTPGNATVDCAYCQLGKTITVRGKIVWGSTSSGAAAIMAFTVPSGKTMNSTYVTGFNIGTGYVGDVSASQPWSMFCQVASTTTLNLVAINASGAYGTPAAISGNAAPSSALWATGDQWYFQFSYEAA